MDLPWLGVCVCVCGGLVRRKTEAGSGYTLTFWRRNYFLILAHPLYKMLIIQEPNTLEL